MMECVSTFKSIEEKVDNEHTCAIVSDLNFQTSTFNFLRQKDDCEEYKEFLNDLKKIEDKVESGDYSDFVELKL